jgi:hypothetical protein
MTTKSKELGTDHRHGMAITTGGPGILTTTWDRSRDSGPQEALIRLELVFNCQASKHDCAASYT